MIKEWISNIHYWIGGKDLINGHAHLRKCNDNCTMFTIDNDGRAVSFFSSTPAHVKVIMEALAPLLKEVEEHNG